MFPKKFWSAKRIALLGTQSDAAIAKGLGVSITSVALKRRECGIPSYSGATVRRCPWGETELGLLRTYTDDEIAKMTGRSIQEVAAKRKSL
jgi:hypothetical protein